MTTIAYNNKVIAYDSRIIEDHIIYSDRFDKRYVRGDISFFLTGDLSEYEMLVDSYVEKRSLFQDAPTARALVYDGKRLFDYFISRKNKLVITPLELDIPVSIGAGSLLAIAFMDMGLSAEDSVRRVARIDTSTGGLIRTFKLN